MQLQLTEKEQAFRDDARTWLTEQLSGPFANLRGRGGPGDEHYDVKGRIRWTQMMGKAGWNCVGWPTEYGGRGVSFKEEVIFNEEYARASGPGRVGHIGETLLGPTLIHFGSEAQQKRFLPKIVSGEEIWCQGYSEPGAGSDLASLQTKAKLVDDEWVIDGQKIWTSLAGFSDWGFVLCRTDSEAPKHRGISYLLIPMNQPGVQIQPIEQMTGGSEFAEVFYDNAKTHKDNIVGNVNAGWKVAMGTLAFERGGSTLVQQQLFQTEFDRTLAKAKQNGAIKDPTLRQRLADASIGLKIMRINALRMLSDHGTELGREAMISKLYWSHWHRDFGELAVDVCGDDGELINAEPYELTQEQTTFLFARADTIYAGSSQIQRNIIAERGLGLPREKK